MKNLQFLILLFFSVSFYSQNIRYEGVVKDNANLPLEMANVMAVNQATKAVDSYSITNDKGKFLLNLKENTMYNIRISFLGLKTQNIKVETKSENINNDVVLQTDENVLEGVEIVREMPVSIKGDTIIYNADSFKTGTERKLGDVLKKLPGVSVNEDGEVEVEGKKVNKLMVDGKDFFDGDTKLGVKNIPADAVDKVQVLRNFNEVGALKGLENNEDNVAMNIKLKSGKKNFWFGDFTAGSGVAHQESRYEINPKLFYYSPKYSVNLLSNFNNIGELPFTVQDYFKFTGGFKNFMKKGGTSFNISSNDLGIALLRNNRAKEILTQFGATNFSFHPNKNLSFSGFVILSATETDLETNNQTKILGQDGKAIVSSENRNENTHQNNNLGLYKFSSTYKPNTKLQLDYDILTKQSKVDEQNDSFQQVLKTDNTLLNSQQLTYNKSQNPVSINQNFNIYFTKNEKNIFAVEMQHFFQEEDPFYHSNLANNPFPDQVSPLDIYNLGLTTQNRYDLNQNRFIKTNKLDTKLDYYYMLTPKSNINFTFGNTYSYQSFNSSIFQILDNQAIKSLNANSINAVRYKFQDIFVGLHYKFLTGKFTFNPGFIVHRYQTENEQLGTNIKVNLNTVLPDIYANYQIKKSETLTYNYSITNDFTDINKFAAGLILNSYNSLFRGNRFLENSLSHTHSLRYFKYNMFNFENIFAALSYSRKLNPVKNSATFFGVNQLSTSINANLADETFNGSAQYGRSFLKYYKASLGVSVNWSKFNNIQNNVILTTESFIQNYTIKASTNYKNFPNIELAYNYIVNDYQVNKFITKRPSIKLDYYFLKAFSLVSEYEFYNYTNNTKTIKNEYAFLNASIIYQKKDTKMEYKLAATNLLNTTSLNDDSFSQFSTRTSQYTVQPRYLILSLKYNL